MSTVGLRHGWTVLWCIWAVLLFTASSAEARWLDRVRGISAGAHVVHQASILESLTRNVAELTDLFGDMLDAVRAGDAEKVENVWRDIEEVPGNIVRDALPAIGVVDAAASVAEGVKNRLGAAKRYIERFRDNVDGFDPRSALAVFEDERHYYVSTTGILGDKPLPTMTYSAATHASTEQQPTDIWKGGHRGERRNDKHPEHTGIVDSVEVHDIYESSLKSLKKLGVASEGDANVARADVERGDYEEALMALDRRRSELSNERPRQVPGDYASDQKRGSYPESVTIVAERKSGESGERDSTLVTRTSTDEQKVRHENDLSLESPADDCVTMGHGLFKNDCNFEVTVFYCARTHSREDYPNLAWCGDGTSPSNRYYTFSTPLGIGEIKPVSLPESYVGKMTSIRWRPCPGSYDELGTGFMSNSQGYFSCKTVSHQRQESAHQSDETPASQQREGQGRFLLTCDTLKRGLSVCVEYEYEKEGEFRAARDQCSSSGFDVRLDASCPKGQRASVCQHSSDDSEAMTYDYDRMRSTDKFSANCRRTKGRYLGNR